VSATSTALIRISTIRRISANAGSARFNFVFDPQRKDGRDFALGLCVNRAAFSRECFRYPDHADSASGRVAAVVALWRVPQAEALLSRVFTCSRELAENGSNCSLVNFGTSWLREGIVAEADCRKTKLLSFVASIQHDSAAGGYLLRKEVADYLRRTGRADCFGKGISEIADKLTGLGPYGFSIAMENAQYDYYFTEKLIDCFVTDTVPVYWGCPSIDCVFDPRGMLRFNTLDELAGLLDQCTWQRYQDMLPHVRRNKQRVF